MAVAEPFTLKEAVLQVLARNPTVYSAVQEYKSRGFEVREAQAGYLPSVDIGLGIGYEEVSNPATNNEDVDLTRKESSINVRQMLFDGFRTSNEVSRQEHREQTAKFEAFSVAENQALRAAEVYIEVLKSKEFVAMAEQTLRVHDKIKKKMAERMKSGVGNESDYTQVSARVALAEGNLEIADSHYRDSITNYLRVVGSQPPIDEMVMPASLKGSFDLDIKQETQLALEQHPTLVAATSDVGAAQAQYSAAKSNMWPRVHLEASKRFDDDIGGIEGNDEDLIVALRFRYDIYAGGGRSARKHYAAYQVEEAKGLRDNAHMQVIEAMRLSFNAYKSLNTKISYQKQHVDFALKTRNAYKEQFNIGKRTLLDVLNTENEYVDAQRSYIRSSYDRQYSEYRIMNAKGQMISSLGLSMSDLLEMN
ncbi:TolC family outer membrane protein [Sinobacterium norvegicum]|uniref:TolC family outer membrane protein n=1 Tax=Sinobacterium norvegicum TaxID=1641715 RepID=UPI001F0039E7|nr:TolC family outer membrane protein [Sinobacterium norvegicum]